MPHFAARGLASATVTMRAISPKSSTCIVTFSRAILLWSFLGETVIVASAGAAIGVAGAAAASGAVQALVGELAALDPWATAASVAILVAVVAIATAWPAARAAREDPLTTLRMS